MSYWKRILISGAAIAALAAGWAVFFNAVRPDGIPFIRPQSSDAVDSKILTLTRAKEFFDSGALFVDARSEEEYHSGHISGAVNLYYTHADQEWEKVLAGVDFEKPIVCYCSGEGCNSSVIVADLLSRVGFDQVYIFHGGWPEWSMAGYPVTGNSATPPPIYKLR